jgi:SAM-dependent methyltransferase
VHPDTVDRIIDLNRQFYQTFALQFSTTRQRLQPGVKRLIQSFPPSASILDLGCGNGELARSLAQRQHDGLYVGLDFSSGLLSQTTGLPPSYHFLQADLAAPDWDTSIQKTFPNIQFQILVAFAVLHHLPGLDLRIQVLRKARTLLPAHGRLYFSVWQFLNSPRLRNRIQPWELVDLSASDLDSEDYLLDWRQGGFGLRYVHHFYLEELADLAAMCGFRVVESFQSDGENHQLGLYQIWETTQQSHLATPSNRFYAKINLCES